jgi:hypothetical protein
MNVVVEDLLNEMMAKGGGMPALRLLVPKVGDQGPVYGLLQGLAPTSEEG